MWFDGSQWGILGRNTGILMQSNRCCCFFDIESNHHQCSIHLLFIIWKTMYNIIVENMAFLKESLLFRFFFSNIFGETLNRSVQKCHVVSWCSDIDGCRAGRPSITSKNSNSHQAIIYKLNNLDKQHNGSEEKCLLDFGVNCYFSHNELSIGKGVCETCCFKEQATTAKEYSRERNI